MKTRQGGALLRRINAVAVLRALHAAESLTLRELAGQAGVVRNTAEDAVERLVRAGLATPVISPAEERSIGRPPKRYRFRPEHGFAVGVDFAVHEVAVLVTDLFGRTKGRLSVDLPAGIPLEDRLGEARGALLRALENARASPAEVLAIGVATTGIVDAHGRVIRSFRLPELEGIELSTELGVVDAADVVVGNDTRLATLAEHWRGAGTDTDDFVNIIAGRVLHAGIVVGGRLLHGAHGAAGEIAYLPHAGWAAAHRALENWPDTREHTFAAAARGEVDALQLVDRLAHDLATGIATLAVVLDPDRVVLGGGLSDAGDTLLQPLKAYLDRLTMFPVPLRISPLTHDAVALGAVRLALDRIEQRLFDPDSPALSALFAEP